MFAWKKLILFFMLLPQPALALFCPTNFTNINFGATPDQVIQACGAPSRKETIEVPPEGPQEWSYFFPQTVTGNMTLPQQGTLKTQMTFSADGKIVNISVNGIGVGSTTICGGTPLSLGDDRDRVKSVCGDPSFINKQNGSQQALGGQQRNTVITTFTYSTSPPVSLIFENGALKERR